MARFSMAWDTDGLLPPSARARAFTPFQSPAGRKLPYGLGWFVDGDGPTKIVWHYGWWVGSSALIVKLPHRKLTFVVLANSDGLSRTFDLGKDRNVRRSPFCEGVSVGVRRLNPPLARMVDAALRSDDARPAPPMIRVPSRHIL